MANYTGDPTATEAPSPPPTPGIAPILAMPVDGAPVNAATFAQAYKVLADFVAWLFSPRALLAAWATAIMIYLNARLQRRFVIDHMGFPGGNIVTWEEAWDKTAAGIFGANLSWISTTGSGTIAKVQSVAVIGSSAQIGISPNMGVAGVPAQSFIQRTDGTVQPHVNMAVAAQWSVQLANAGTNHVFAVHGLVPHASSFPDVGSIPWGCRFRKNSADVNWFCEVDGVAPVDSTVPPVASTFQRFRIEIVGTGTSDDSTARVIFYINDAIVANVAHVVTPTNTDRLVPFFGAKGDNTGATQETMYVGPVQYRQNIFQTV